MPVAEARSIYSSSHGRKSQDSPKIVELPLRSITTKSMMIYGLGFEEKKERMRLVVVSQAGVAGDGGVERRMPVTKARSRGEGERERERNGSTPEWAFD
ncbi:hypothetical protein ACLB2K_066188 [Fragaria x ananassa]